jgi:isopentenyl-diphosphate Delta-isomerase
MLDDTTEIAHRKADHLDLCATDAVAYKERTTLLECVRFEHASLPELALDEIDTRVRLLGKTLRAPIVIAGMTGGHSRAAEVNRTLAAIAEARGYGFGLGSQRALHRDPAAIDTYRVRDVCPTTLLLGNIGVVQARDLDTACVQALADAVEADAMCVHMNPAMELVQPGGDRDFRGGLETFERLVRELDVPVVAKETGNGVGASTARMLYDVGVRHVDTSGAGGTSWVGVEALRAEARERRLGEALWDWGVPTAASVVACVGAGHSTIATGGIATGLDVARAVALGAEAAGIARGAFMALTHGGREGAEAFFDEVERELRAVMLLVGARDVLAIRRAPKVITGELASYAARR